MLAIMASPIHAWESFFDEVSSFLRSVERQSDTRHASESFTHYVLEKITVYMSSIHLLLHHMRETTADTNVTRLDPGQSLLISDFILMLYVVYRHLRTTAHEWDLYLDEIYQHSHSAMYLAPTLSESQRRRGRPRFDISCDQLEYLYLSSMSFSWTKIAAMLGVSRMTIYRRRIEYGIASSSGISISDDDLKSVLQQVSAEQPALGETMMWGRIKSMGFHVTRKRLRFALREIDPLQRALRWSTQLARRQPYSVPGPNSLWHIGKYYHDKCMIYNDCMQMVTTS